jgi:Na+-transporting methylmalonyl-CoA/oxaloacetate decarboxylase gamma subunit
MKMDGITISLTTALITIMISLFIAVVIKIMVALLNIFTKPEEETAGGTPAAALSDESDIATVIAIARSRKQTKR